jgi:hypothetical protein
MPSNVALIQVGTSVKPALAQFGKQRGHAIVRVVVDVLVVVVVDVVVVVVVVAVVVVVVANVQLRPSPVADTYDEFKHAHPTADA